MGSCPRLHGGRLSAGTTEGRAPTRDAPTEMPGGGEGPCYGDEIPRLGFAAFGMTMALGKPPKGMKMDSV